METDEEILIGANRTVTQLSEDESKELLKEIYGLIIKVLKSYCDLEERFYSILSLWIIGTWFHKSFHTYPYLFFNAMKGSGKTRVLKLIASLSKNGELMANLSEAVLFRTASLSTLLIDEFESVGKKDKGILRELLNGAYKKGTKVKRAYKVKGAEKEEYKIEEYDVFCPIAMANIAGMESVLSDRCITMILEKSDKPNITRKVEIFDIDPRIIKIKSLMASIPNSAIINGELCQNIYYMWNMYIDDGGNGYNDYNDYNGGNVNDSFFNRIKKTNIDGRHLELFFSLFLLADKIGVLEDVIKFAEEIVSDRHQQDLIENRDITFLDFISQREHTIDFISVKQLVNEFRFFSDLQDEEDVNWLNVRWLGRALRRLGLVIDQRHMGKGGRQVMINFAKAIQKISMLKPVNKIKEIEEIEPPQEIMENIAVEKIFELEEEKREQIYKEMEIKDEGNI